jgi:hypothetical protein
VHAATSTAAQASNVRRPAIIRARWHPRTLQDPASGTGFIPKEHEQTPVFIVLS